MDHGAGDLGLTASCTMASRAGTTPMLPERNSPTVMMVAAVKSTPDSTIVQMMPK